MYFSLINFVLGRKERESRGGKRKDGKKGGNIMSSFQKTPIFYRNTDHLAIKFNYNSFHFNEQFLPQYFSYHMCNKWL
jgi:hypothetical protein